MRQDIILFAEVYLLFRGERNLPTLRIDCPIAPHAYRVEGPIFIHPMSKPRQIRTHGLRVPVRRAAKAYSCGGWRGEIGIPKS